MCNAGGNDGTTTSDGSAAQLPAAGGFDPDPARRGLTHIELAFTRWSEFLDVHPPRPMSNSVAAKQFLHANSYVVDLVRWIRAVDDYLQGRGSGPGEGPGLPSYVTARADPTVVGPLDRSYGSLVTVFLRDLLLWVIPGHCV